MSSLCASSRHRMGGLLVLACLASTPSRARAQSPSATARVLFRDARALMDKGKFEQACPKLEESLRLDHGMGTQFNLAHCWEQTGRTASAWGLFLDVAAAASAAGQPKRETAARARADAIEPKLRRVLVQVTDAVPGLVVTRSGEELGRGSWGTAVPVDPGMQAFEAKAPGKLPWTKEVEAGGPGETITVVIPALQAEKVDVPAEAPIGEGGEQPPPQPADSGGGISSGRAVTSIVLAAVGVGGLVTGTIFGLKANSETDAAKGLCDGGSAGNLCDRDPDGGAAEQAELEEHRENAESAATISYIGWGIGAAGLISSAIVLLTAPDEAPSDEATLRIEPAFAPGFIGTGLRGTF